MTTGLIWFFGFADDEVTSLYCFGVMNCIQYAKLKELDKIFLLLKTVLILVA